MSIFIKRGMRRLFLLLLSLVCLGCGDGTTNKAAGDEEEDARIDGVEIVEISDLTRLCNGAAELCNKRYDEIAYATTHNSMSAENDDWVAPNQIRNISEQLSDGVRGFMLDAYFYEGDLRLCHGDCEFGQILLSDALGIFKSFLDANPNEVVTIIFESYITAAQMESAFIKADLISRLRVQQKNEPWPSLNEMIDDGKRLVVFADDSSGGPSWYHYVWNYCWDTEWHVTAPSEFTCDVSRGDGENSLFILNHFVYGAFDLPSKKNAEQANANPFFIERARECLAKTGRMPNFITTDYYSIGDIFKVVDELNGVQKTK